MGWGGMERWGGQTVKKQKMLGGEERYKDNEAGHGRSRVLGVGQGCDLHRMVREDLEGSEERATKYLG